MNILQNMYIIIAHKMQFVRVYILFILLYYDMKYF